MKNKNETTTLNNNSIGFAGLLTLAFIILKLCKVIKWKWVWVLCPLWVDFLLVIIIFIVTLIIVGVKS